MGGAFADAAEPEYNSVRKQNGGTKRFDGTIALNIHILSCPSYKGMTSVEMAAPKSPTATMSRLRWRWAT